MNKTALTLLLTLLTPACSGVESEVVDELEPPSIAEAGEPDDGHESGFDANEAINTAAMVAGAAIVASTIKDVAKTKSSEKVATEIVRSDKFNERNQSRQLPPATKSNDDETKRLKAKNKKLKRKLRKERKRNKKRRKSRSSRPRSYGSRRSRRKK